MLRALNDLRTISASRMNLGRSVRVILALPYVLLLTGACVALSYSGYPPWKLALGAMILILVPNGQLPSLRNQLDPQVLHPGCPTLYAASHTHPEDGGSSSGRTHGALPLRA